jgi:DNA-binding winged helix-turn-helix (wHTH) protein/WD40 repeat protein
MHRASNPLNDATDRQLLALRFGPFELDVRSGELRRNGTTVRLQPQPFKVLVLLACRPGEVVTREEIQAEVWPAGTFVDFEQSLNFCVRQIRASLGDNANAPRYLETLPRRGYRWVGGAVEKVTALATVREWPRPVAIEPRAPWSADPSPDRPSPPLPATSPVARARAWWPLAAALLLVAAAYVAREWLPSSRSPPAEPPAFQRITFHRGSVSAARFGPDGQVVYSGSWDGGRQGLHVAGSDTGDSRALEIFEATVAAVSPSGEVAFLRGGVLARAPLSGGPPKDVLKGVVAADWAADGSDFAVVRSGEGGFRVEFPVGHVLASAARVSRVRLSPDRSHLAIAEHPIMDDDRGRVRILDRDGKHVAATEEWASLDGIAWAPGGREVWFTASPVGADNAVRALSLDGRVRTVLSGMGRLVLHDLAPDGRVLLERATLRSEMLFRRAGEPEDRDLSWLDFSAPEGIAPDGGTLLFYESGQGGGADYSTFLRKTDGSLPVRVGSGRALALSPDGRWVLSVSLRKPDSMDLTPTGPGENRKLQVPGVAAHEAAGFVGRDGLVFVTGRDAAGKRATWITDIAGAAPRRLPLPEGHILTQNTFSPDGGHFVSSCPKEDLPCLYDTATGNSAPLRGVQKGWWPVGWDARGRLYFRDRSKRLPETLWRVDAATGRATSVAELSPRDRAGALAVMGVLVAKGGEAWTYNVMRRLSELHVVTGVK